MAFELRITDAGRAALADGTNRGTNAVRLTKMAIGSGQGPGGAADDGRTALRNQRAAVALGGSTMVSGRIAVRGEFNPAAAYGVTELGLLGRVGADPEILVAYWTDGGERLASTVADTRLVIAGSIDIAPAAAEVTVNVAASVSLGDPALTAALTAVGNQVATIEGQRLNTRLRALEDENLDSRLDALEGRPAGATSTDLTALTKRITALEAIGITAKFAALEADVGIPVTRPQRATLNQAGITSNTAWYEILNHTGAGLLHRCRGRVFHSHSGAYTGQAVDFEITIDGTASQILWGAHEFGDVVLTGTPDIRMDYPYFLRFETSLRVRARWGKALPAGIGTGSLRASVLYSTDA